MPVVRDPQEPCRCLIALGPGIEMMRQTLLTQFFPQHLPTWTVVGPEPLSTDALLTAADHAESPWDVVLVTDRLSGTVTLAQALVNIKLRWPACHITVLVRGMTPSAQTLAASLASYQIYNLFWDQPSPEILVSLLTEAYAWDHIRHILPSTPPDLPPVTHPTAPGKAEVRPGPLRAREPKAVAPPPRTHATIAVVAGSGGVGKSGWVANMAVAGAAWHSVLLDADPWQPGLIAYFQDPSLMEPPAHQWQTLLGALADHDPQNLAAVTWPAGWTEGQRGLIRQYVHDAYAVRPGVHWVPGVSPHYPTPVPYVPRLLDEMIAATYALGQITWIDTATLPDPRYVRDACRFADHVVVIVTPQYPVVRHTLVMLDALSRWGVPSSKMTWALLRAGRGGFSTKDLQRVQLASWPCIGEWPDDAAAWETALQRHHPLAESHPERWQAALTSLVGPLPDSAATPKSGRLAQRWRAHLSKTKKQHDSASQAAPRR